MLRYTGAGFVVGIPARDLTDEEIEQYGGVEVLLQTGLYVVEEQRRTRRAERQQEEVEHGHQSVEAATTGP